MTAFSDYLESALLNHLFNATPLSSPASVYISLHASAGASESTAAWTATELNPGSALSYVREDAGPLVWSEATVGSVTTVSDVQFATATSSWGTVTHFGIWDAVSSGNLFFYGALPNSKIVNNGDVATFTSGNLTVSLA